MISVSAADPPGAEQVPLLGGSDADRRGDKQA